jgi:TRAP-type C4-dicarboxylate transport system permease small subunit
LLLSALKGGARHALELWALAAAAVLAALLTLYGARLAWQSHTFHDISTASDATPLWIPQIGMALGSLILSIALLDEWVLELRGQRIAPVHDGEALHE